jgi:molybdate transport system regulatory protein
MAEQLRVSIKGPLKLKVQIMSGDEAAIGPGRALVLEAIAKTGSISAAGRSLGMSYRRTWLHVDAMNRCWQDLVVEATSGGGSGRGARLTPFGQELLRCFRVIERRMETATEDGEYRKLVARLRPSPLPAEKSPVG